MAKHHKMKRILYFFIVSGLITPSVSWAISTNFLTKGQMPAASSTFMTSSTTPTQNALVLLFISNTQTSADTNPTVSGNGMTWVRVLGQNDSDSNGAISVFRAMNTTSSPSAGEIMVTFGASQTRAAWTLSEFTGVDTSGLNGSGAVVQSSTAQSSCAACTSFSASTTLAAFANANNAAYGAFYFENLGAGPATSTAGSGFTLITKQDLKNPASDVHMTDEWLSTATTTVDLSLTGINGTQTAIGALEIQISTATAVRRRKPIIAFEL